MWQKILQGIRAYFTVSIVTNITGILQSILTLRYLTLGEYGQYTLLLSFFATGKLFFDLGSKSLFVSEIAQANGENNQARVKGLFSVLSWFLGSMSIVVTAVFIIIGLWRQNNLYHIIAVYSLFFAINLGFDILLLSHTKFNQTAGQQIVRSASRLGFLLLIPFFPTGSMLFWVMLSHVIKEIVVMIFSIRWVSPIFHSLRKVTLQSIDVGTIFKQQGIFVLMSYPIRQLITELPVWMLTFFWDITAVGVYGAARKAFSLITTVFAYVETILIPLLPEQMNQFPDKVRIAIRQSQKYTFWLTVGMLLVVLPLSPWIIQLLGPEEYAGVIRPFQIILLTAVFTPFIQSHRPILFALKEQRWFFIMQLLSLLTYAPLLLLFIPPRAAVGAVVVLVLNGIIHTTLRSGIIRRIAPQFWVSPFTIFEIEEFDRKLIKRIQLSIQNLR